MVEALRFARQMVHLEFALTFDLSTPEMIAASCVVAVGACVQGNVGFGLAMVSAPLLMLIDPSFVPAPIISCSLLITGTIFLRERESVDMKTARWAMLGLFIGSTVAGALLAQLPEKAFTYLFSALVLIAVGLSVLGLRLSPDRRTMAIAGMVSGFMGTISSIGGPPVAMALQKLRGGELRSTISACFLFSNAIALTNLAIAGKFHTSDLPLVAVLLPGVVVGLGVSHFTRRFFDRHNARPVILGLSGMSAIVVLIRTLMD